MSTAISAHSLESSSSPPPSPSKRPKIEVSADPKAEEKEEKQEEDDEEGEEAEQDVDDETDEEELTFTACQLLCGNLDISSSLLLLSANESSKVTTTSSNYHQDEDNGGGDDWHAEVTTQHERARTVLRLLSPFTSTTTTTTRRDDDETEKNKSDGWSLDLVRTNVLAFDAILNDGNNSCNPPAHQQLQILLAFCSDSPHTTDAVSPPSPDCSPRPNHPTSMPIWKLVQAAILSNAHVQIANHFIDQALGRPTKTKEEENDEPCSPSCLSLWKDANDHVVLALVAWPCNPSALLCLANLQRMGRHHHDGSSSSRSSSSDDPGRLEYALNLYLAAAKCAYMTQTASVQLMESKEFSNDDKFLVESILLQLSAQQVDDDDDDDDDDETSDDDDDEKKKAAPQSKALVIASYMTAMLASCLGKHDLAARVLRRFCGPTSNSSPITRIHPRVWEAAAAAAGTSSCNGAVLENNKKTPLPPTTPKAAAFTPCVFPNAISQELLATLRYAFRPNAPYWKQSQYERNVYYSFWTDWPLPQPQGSASSSCCSQQQYIVSNAIEHYIVTCLLPRVQSVGVNVQTNLKGFEWWVHTRPQGANLGHQLHFDTDEALLDQDTILDVPLTASVTYLTVDNDENDDDDSNHQFGATILFDQTPQSTENAQVAWISKPKSKAFVAFPGDLLHGVLPCNCISSKIPMGKNGENNKNSSDEEAPPLHRLTFMVNFWACRIPDRLKERKLYGPSGPFPPRTAQHSWVEDIMGDALGYPRTVELPTSAIAPSSLDDDDSVARSTSFMAVSPAWETIDFMPNATATPTGAATSSSSLQQHYVAENKEWWHVSSASCHSLDLPPDGGGIHQRFFVKNAPEYFRRTLYEK